MKKTSTKQPEITPGDFKDLPAKRQNRAPLPVKFDRDESLGDINIIPDENNGDALHALSGSESEQIGWNLLLKTVFAALPKKHRVPILADSISATLTEMKPKNPLEAMLISQMVVCHQQGTLIMYETNQAEGGLPAEAIRASHNLAIKHFRTFAALMDAYSKAKSGGKQSVEVRHVTVQEGGQAVIGNVNRGEG